ncbi:MAG TPA: hypothetical protein VFE63_18915 [Roseiarcus sp.]|jgi:hypothetical protein|nr:hypothetical protein [Roseiarcus sp.]
MTAEQETPREKPAVREGVIAAIMGGFFVFVIVAAVGLHFFFQSLAPNETRVTETEFSSPRLQTRSDGLRDPEIARQQADLRQFRWIDRAHGQFQIPIERAMRLVAARGAKAYEPVPNGGQVSQDNREQSSQTNGGRMQ